MPIPRVALHVLAALVITSVVLPVAAEAISVSVSPGQMTTTPGAVTFATFDAPTDASIATITGGSVCPSGNCSGSTNPTGTAYLFTGPSQTSITVTFAETEDYFGLFVGTEDSFNRIQFFNASTLIADFFLPGSLAAEFRNYTADNSSELFNRVVLSSTGCCFEVDNLATDARAAVPEPPTLLLLAVGALGALGAFRAARAGHARPR